MDLRRMLKQLQAAVRAEKDVPPTYGRQKVLPKELRTADQHGLSVSPEIVHKIEELVAALLADPCYEHLDKAADDAVWEFVCYAAVQRSTDHVGAFLKERYEDGFSTTVRFGVEYLTVGQSFAVHDVTFMPLPDADSEAGQYLRLDDGCGAIACVEVFGSHLGRMIERGRERALHALRVLRISLANAHALDHTQLRFRLSQLYVAGDWGPGFLRHRDRPIALELPQPPGELLARFTLLPIRFDETTEIGRQAKLALGWIDAAQLALDPVQRVAFLFSALEAMLGDKSSGLKAPMLVYYRTLLGQVVDGGFPHPSRLYVFYDEVRSNAVHGEAVPVFTTDEVSRLEWTIRDALSELLKLCEERRLTKRSQVRAALLATDDAQQTYKWLQSYTPAEWWRRWSPWGTSDSDTRSSDSQAPTTTLSGDGEDRS